MQPLRFVKIVPSAHAWQQLVEAILRPTTSKQVLRMEATQDGDAARGQTPN
jgi:hypothetical protein